MKRRRLTASSHLTSSVLVYLLSLFRHCLFSFSISSSSNWWLLSFSVSISVSFSVSLSVSFSVRDWISSMNSKHCLRVHHLIWHSRLHLHVSIHWWKHEARSRANHVTEFLNSESSYSRSSVSTSFRESYLFHSLNLEACSLHLIEWDRIDIVERWIDTDQSQHLDTDQKTIRDNLRRTSFDWWSILLNLNRSFLLVMKLEIIFRDFFYIWFRFLSLSIYSRCLQFESELNSNDLFFWISFQSNSCRFAVRAIFDFCKHQILAKSLRNSLNFYNDVRFWITKSIRRTTNHNHKQKERRFEERTFHAKNNNLKKTQFQRLWSLRAISRRIWWVRRSEIRHCRFENTKRISCFSSYSWRMSHEKTWLFDCQSTVRSLEKRHWNALNRRRTCYQFRKVQFRRHRSSSQNRLWSQLYRLFMTDTITIRIKRITITRTIITDKIRSINWEFIRKRKTINKTTISRINQTTIFIFILRTVKNHHQLNFNQSRDESSLKNLCFWKNHDDQFH